MWLLADGPVVVLSESLSAKTKIQNPKPGKKRKNSL